jgi:uncharacterized membrane protein
MQTLLEFHIHQYHLVFVLWNIFLALVPCWIAYYLARRDKMTLKHPGFWLLFVVWFFMLPNTAYLFFMTRHVVDYCDAYDNYRVCIEGGSWIPLFFFAYAAIGIPTFYFALSKMTDLFVRRGHKIFVWLLPTLMIPATSIGLLYGLYERYNSWDVLQKPALLLKKLAEYFTRSERLTDFLVFTLLLTLIYIFTHLLSHHDTRSS